MQGDGHPVLGLQFLRRWGQPVRRAGDMTRPVPHSASLRANSVPARSVDARMEAWSPTWTTNLAKVHAVADSGEREGE